ncbi:MAG TPA: alpha/beta hydrolase [Anaerolineales bacterium]|nr:alpha/beta hydrolase [Anaerolineales bacterium]
MKKMKRVLLGLLIVVVISTLGFFIWASNAAQPTETALNALSTDAQVEIRQEDGFITFAPVQAHASTGFIFYPGGRVDYRAYAPVLHQIAERGYFVALVHAPLNLAFFDTDAADQVMGLFPEIDQWAVGGHSLGGVAAASYAEKHLDEVAGLVLWASYPANDAMINSDIKAIVIYGTNDMEGDQQIGIVKARLPSDTQFVTIEGGNHAQFGSYGPQPGDRPASISAEEQWNQATELTVRFLESLNK